MMLPVFILNRTKSPGRFFRGRMRAFMVLTALWTLIVGAAGAAVATETATNAPSFVIKSWQTSDGLPQNSVTAMAHTPDGYLWVGTRGGLARFDGVRFRNYGL